MQPKYYQNNIWIVKPSGLNCGRGISIYNDLKRIVYFIRSHQTGTQYKKNYFRFVVQKYIEKPMLYNGRKFDIRTWCVVTNDFNIYLYKEGYLRTSSEMFTCELNENNKMIHLTNYISFL